MSKLNKINPSAKQRKAIYGVVTAVFAALVAFNIVTPGGIDKVTESITAAITCLTTVMAFANTDAASDIIEDNFTPGGTGGSDDTETSETDAD